MGIADLFQRVLAPVQPPIFPELKRPLIFAHQGGELLAPTNTMAAFAVADSIGGVDFLDIDVHMTRDGHIVGIHDSTVDRTTNGSGRVDSFTLAEIQRLDAGYRFKDLQGAYSYRGKGVRIPALEEVFSTYAGKFYLHFEVKDAYPKNGPSQIEAGLWSLIQRYHMEQKVIVSSFRQDVVLRFQQVSGGQCIVGAGQAEVTRFVLAHKFGVSGFYHRQSNVLSIPITGGKMNLRDRRLIDGAHRLGMQLYYWTIDEKAAMKELIALGADGLFTNRPDILQEVIAEMQLK